MGSEVCIRDRVSPDTVRRWADAGRLATERTGGGHRTVAVTELARLAQELAADGGSSGESTGGAALSARNRFTGLVTRVVRDGVMAQVEVQAGHPVPDEVLGLNQLVISSSEGTWHVRKLTFGAERFTTARPGVPDSDD